MTDTELEKLIDSYVRVTSALEKKDYTKAITILEPIVREFFQNGIEAPLTSSLDAFLFKVTTHTEQEIKWIADIRLLLCLNLVKCYIALGNDSKAINILEFVIEFWHDYSPAYRELGKLYLKQKNLQEAYRYLRDAIKHGNTDIETYKALTFIACELKFYKEAIKYGEQALQIEPDNIDIFKDLLVAYNETGQLNKITQMLERMNKKGV